MPVPSRSSQRSPVACVASSYNSSIERQESHQPKAFFLGDKTIPREQEKSRVPGGRPRKESLVKYFARYPATRCTSTQRISTIRPPPTACHALESQSWGR